MQSAESTHLDTAATLADFLNVSVAYVRKLTRLNQVPVIRIGRRTVRFNRETVLRALEEKMEVGGDAHNR